MVSRRYKDLALTARSRYRPHGPCCPHVGDAQELLRHHPPPVKSAVFCLRSTVIQPSSAARRLRRRTYHLLVPSVAGRWSERVAPLVDEDGIDLVDN